MVGISYLIPKEHHKDLYIFEGYMHDFLIDNNDLEIVIRHVECASLPDYLPYLDYFDIVKIKFINLGYMNLELSLSKNGQLDSKIKFGKLNPSDELLDYGGAWGYFGDSNIISWFTLELTCQSIELLFLDQMEHKSKYKKLI